MATDNILHHLHRLRILYSSLEDFPASQSRRSRGALLVSKARSSVARIQPRKLAMVSNKSPEGVSWQPCKLQRKTGVV